MDKYNQVLGDKEIINIYKEIEIFEDMDKGMAYHNLQHVTNVANLVDKVLNDLNYRKTFIEEAKIGALLHDVGSIKGKKDHAIRSHDYAKDYLDRKNIKLDNEDMVLEAIKIHSDGFDSDNIMALTLIFCDKLDIKCTRVAKEGYNTRSMRQLQYINDITIEICDNKLIIRFVCSSEIDKVELEDFYFIPKVFKSIRSFSNKMNLEPTVYFNDNNWKLFENI